MYLVLCQDCIFGYRRSNLTRASVTLKTPVNCCESRAFRMVSQAVLSRCSVYLSGIRCFRHWLTRTESSISTIVSQEPWMARKVKLQLIEDAPLRLARGLHRVRMVSGYVGCPIPHEFFRRRGSEHALTPAYIRQSPLFDLEQLLWFAANLPVAERTGTNCRFHDVHPRNPAG